MKKVLILVLVVAVLAVVAVAGFSAEPGKRTEKDFAAEFKALVGADSTGKLIMPERNEIRYPFMPLYKGGKLIGYGSWVSLTIYQHPEDLIVVVNPDGTLQNFKAIDANSHHANMQDENWKKKFYGMTKDRDFITKTDLNAGSTISTNLMFAEMKTILFVFDTYIKPNVK